MDDMLLLHVVGCGFEPYNHPFFFIPVLEASYKFPFLNCLQTTSIEHAIPLHRHLNVGDTSA